jgi:iron(III) transport system ATP-binding protein
MASASGGAKLYRQVQLFQQRERHRVSAVTLEHVSQRFGTVNAVDDVSLSVQQGEFLTLLGPSGCGKTTTLRMIAGLQQNTAGRILIDQSVVSDIDAGVFVPPERRGLGMVFQSYAIWPHMNVFDNVAYPLRVRRAPKRQIADRVQAMLRMVELDALAERPATALSGGQQQRVAIARALVFEPKVLLLDEPLSNLDAKLRTQMGEEFRALQRRLGITTIYVTHDQDEAMSLSDTIVVMHDGHVLQIGSPRAIYQRPVDRIVAAFVGAPNLLEARVVQCKNEGDGSFALRIEGRGWIGQCHSEVAFEPGQPVVVVARPESLVIAQMPGSVANADFTLAGRISHSSFRGARQSLVVDVAGLLLHVDAPPLLTVTDGDTVTVIAPRGSLWAVRSA